MSLIFCTVRQAQQALAGLGAITALGLPRLANALPSAQDKTPENAGSSTVEKSGPLSVAISSNPQGLMPLTSSDATTSGHIHARLFESLLDRNIDTFQWEPALAKSWKISDDGQQFTFDIDEKARFWDGTPVTAEDVKFSYDIIFREGVDTAPLRPYYQAIAEVKVVGPGSVSFRTKDVYYKNFDVAAGLTILKKDFYEKLYAQDKTLAKSETTRQAMGTGMWKLEKWDENRRLILARDENYWAREREQKAGRWTFDRIILNVIQDNAVQLETLKKGEISYLSPTPKQFALEMNDPPFGTRLAKVKAVNKSPSGYKYIAWNQKNALLEDRRVRWALSHLANVPLWVKKFEYDLSEPTIGPFSPKSDQHDPSIQPVEFSVKLARQKLAEAGWTEAGKDGFLVKNGRRFELSILFPTQAKDVYEPILTEYKNQAKKVGIDIQLRGLEWTSFVKKLDDRDFDAVTLAWTRGEDMDLKQIWHSESIENNGSNFISYKNPDLDQLIEKHRKTMDYDARIQLARQMQKMVYNDQPYTFLTERKHVLYAAQSDIKRPKDVFAYGLGTVYWIMPDAQK